MATPVRYPSGVSTVSPQKFLADLIVPSPTSVHQYFNDFDTYAAGDWTVTASTGTAALTAGNNGDITLTTAATASDIQHILKNPAAFQITPGYRAHFGVNITSADVTAPGFIFGLQSGGTAFAPTDGVYFTKAEGATTLSLVLNKGGTATTLATGIALSASTATQIGFEYDGRPTPTLYVYANGIRVVSLTDFTNLTTANLAPAVGIQTATAAAKSLVVDYILAVSETASR